MMTRIAAAILSGALALSPGLSLAADDGPSVEQLAVETAQTPAEHNALAQDYRAKAAKARAEAKNHKDMLRYYSGSKITQKQRMNQHCTSLSKKYTGIADDYDALAKLHEEAAKTAQ